MKMQGVLCLCSIIGIALAGAQAQEQQLTTPRLAERAQGDALSRDATDFDSFWYAEGTLYSQHGLQAIRQYFGTPRVDNAAGLQLQGDKTSFPILATLPSQGSSFFITTLKPCGIILPHLHPRGTETYIVISGTMGGGLAEENGGRQNITFDTGPGQGFLVPQGLLHYNVNRQCTPLVFIQSFNSADAGTINVIGALAALKAVDNSTISSSSAGGVMASPQNAFGLDQQCLQRCGLGATGGGLSGLSAEMQRFVGLSSSPAPSPGSLPSLSNSG